MSFAPSDLDIYINEAIDEVVESGEYIEDTGIGSLYSSVAGSRLVRPGPLTPGPPSARYPHDADPLTLDADAHMRPREALDPNRRPVSAPALVRTSVRLHTIGGFLDFE